MSNRINKPQASPSTSPKSSRRAFITSVLAGAVTLTAGSAEAKKSKAEKCAKLKELLEEGAYSRKKYDERCGDLEEKKEKKSTSKKPGSRKTSRKKGGSKSGSKSRAEQERRAREAAEANKKALDAARNAANKLITETEGLISKNDKKVSTELKQSANTKIIELKAIISSKDKDAIVNKTTELQEVNNKIKDAIINYVEPAKSEATDGGPEAGTKDEGEKEEKKEEESSAIGEFVREIVVSALAAGALADIQYRLRALRLRFKIEQEEDQIERYEKAFDTTIPEVARRLGVDPNIIQKPVVEEGEDGAPESHLRNNLPPIIGPRSMVVRRKVELENLTATRRKLNDAIGEAANRIETNAGQNNDDQNNA